MSGSSQKKKARIICVTNHKGGVGKTTSTCNIGAGLARKGERVLLVDMDPQANLSLCFGIRDAERSVYDLLMGQSPNQAVTLNIYENLDLIPANLDLAGAEIELAAEQGREMILQEELEPVMNQYDFIIMDCGPSLGLLTTNALTAAHEVLIPVQAQYFSLQGISKLTGIIEKIQRRLNSGLTIGGVLITQFDSRKVINRDIAEVLEKHFGDCLFKTRIRNNVTLVEAPAKGMDVFNYNSKSYGAKDYEALCEEILERSGIAKVSPKKRKDKKEPVRV